MGWVRLPPKRVRLHLKKFFEIPETVDHPAQFVRLRDVSLVFADEYVGQPRVKVWFAGDSAEMTIPCKTLRSAKNLRDRILRACEQEN